MNKQLTQKSLLWACVFSLVLCGWAAAQTVNPQHLELIRKAMPGQPVAAVQKPRELLVFDLSKGFQHGSIPYCAAMLDIMAEKTGAFKVTHSVDMEVFRAENLARFDAILMNNTTDLPMGDPAYRQGIMDFVRSGKGIIGIHAATDNFKDWPEGSEMLGGMFDGHPWGACDTAWAVRVDKPGHPLNKSFNGQGFKIKDEIYRSKNYSRTRVQVLVSLDLSDPVTGKVDGMRPTDKDIAISWIRDYDKGRVFYCSFGHNFDIYWNESILAHYLAGIQYALGDNPQDGASDVARVLKQVAAYKAGQSRAAQYELESYIRMVAGIPAELAAYERELLKALAGPVSGEGRDILCRLLGQIGSEASLEVLGQLLADPQTSSVARYALERINGDKVDDLLIRVAQGGNAAVQAGAVTSLGVRRCERAVPQIAALLTGGDEVLTGAAIQSLGAIGGAGAIESLLSYSNGVSGTMRTLAQDALIRAANGQAANASPLAHRVYTSLLKSPEATVRIAALQGLIRVDKDAASAVAAAMQDEDARVATAAIGLSRRVAGEPMMRVLVAALAQMAPPYQTQIIAALADRGDAKALPAIVEKARGGEGEIKVQAIRALETLGNGSVVPMLAEMAAQGPGLYRGLAVETLNRMDGAEINPAIIALLATADDGVKVVLIRALAERLASEAVPQVLAATASQNGSVASESFKALRIIADSSHLPAILEQMVQSRSGSIRDEAGRTVAALAGGNPGLALAAYAKATDVDVRCSLLKVLVLIGAEQGLPVVRAALTGGDAKLVTEAIRSMSSWPNAAPLGDLLGLVEGNLSGTDLILAVRGCASLLEKDGDKSPEQKVDLFQKLIAKTDNGDTRKQILGGVAKVGHVKALELALSCLDDANLQSEAAQAVISVADQIRDTRKEEAKNALTAVKSKIKNDDLLKKADEVLGRIK